MAIGRGESVGEAYIRIHADGSALPREIKDQFAEEKGAWEDVGEERGLAEEKAYNDAKKKQRRKDQQVTQREVMQSIQRERGQRRALEEFLAGKEGEAIRKGLHRELSKGGGTGGKELGDRLFAELSESARRNGNSKIFRDLFGELADVTRRADETEEQFAARKKERDAEQRARAERQAKALAAIRDRAVAGIKRDEAEQAKIDRFHIDRQNKLRASIEEFYAAQAREEAADIKRKEHTQRRLIVLDRQRDKINAGVFAGDSYHNRRAAIADREKFLAEYKLARARAEESNDYRELNTLLNDRQIILNRYNSKLIRGNGLLRGGRRETTEFERALNRASTRFESGFLSKLDNNSSRGNIFIRTLRAMTLGLLKFASVRVLNGLKQLGRGFGNVMGILNDPKRSRGGKVLGLLDLGFTSAASGATKLVGSIAKGVAGLSAFYVILGPIVALVSMLGGAIVALSSSIIIGLVGAIGAVAPLLGVVGVAAGVAVLALSKMTKEQKKALGVKFKPVVDEYKQLQDVARKGLFSQLDTQIPKIKSQLSGLQPLIGAVSKAMAKGGTTFLDALGGDDQKANLRVFKTEFPIAIDKLSHVFSDLFVGILNYFRALLPTTQKFLDSFELGSKRFRAFTASAAGQNKIKTYMDGAWESAKLLGGTLKLTYQVLRDLTNAGKATGDSMLGSINSSLARYDKYLQSATGRKEVKQFFDDVKTFMGSLGNFTAGVAKLFGGLDDEVSRGSLNGVLEIVGAFAQTIGDAMPIISAFTRGLADALDQLKGPIKDILKNLRPLIKGTASDISDIMTVAVKGLVLVLDPFLRVLAGIARFMGDHPAIFQPLITSLVALKLAFAVQAAFSTAAIGTRIGLAVLSIQSMATNAATNIRSSAARIGKATAGIGIALGGMALGNSVGGNAGVGISALSGAAGGALIGSAIAPGLGTAAGAAIGGVAGLLSGLKDKYDKAGEAGKLAAQKAAEARRLEREQVQGLITDLQSLGGEYNKEYKLGVAKTLNDSQSTKKDADGKLLYKKDVLTRATNAGIDPQNAVNAALGDKAAFAQIAQMKKAYEYKDAITTLTTGKGISGKDLQQMKLYNELYNIVVAKQPQFTKAELGFQALRKAIGENVTPLNLLEGGYKNLGKELQGNNLDRLTAFGARNTVVLGENVEQIGKLAAAQLKAGKSNDQVGLTYANNILGLQKQAQALHLNKEQTDKLITEVSKVPKGVSTSFATPGAAIAAGLAINLKGKLAAIPKNVQTLIAQKNLTPTFIQDLTNRLGRVPTRKDIELALRQTGANPDALNNTLRNLPHEVPINVKVQYNGPAGIKVGGSAFQIRAYARGGTANSATAGIFGEAGPEALVPLRRPLSQVDPSVRALSAFAQGIPFQGQKYAAGGVAGSSGKSITIADGAIRVQTMTTDPIASAHEITNYIVARSGIGS